MFNESPYPAGSTAWWEEQRGYSAGLCARDADDMATIRSSIERAGVTVHRSVGGERHDHLIACTSDWTEGKWGDASTPYPDVFLAEDGRLFTFREELTTCSGCTAWRTPEGGT